MELIIQKKERPTYLFILLCVAKAVYIFSIALLLPEYWSGVYWFDKDIQLGNIIYELVPFVVCCLIYIYYFRKDNPITFFSTLLFCIYVIPQNSTMVLSNYDFKYFCLTNVFSMFVLIAVGKLGRKTKENKFKDSFDERLFLDIWNDSKLLKITRMVIYAVCIITVMYVYLVGGLNFKVAFSSSSDMYATRSQFAEYYASNVDSIVSYFILIWSSVYAIMLPIGLYIGVKKNKIIDSTLCCFAYLALYTLTMEKSLILKPMIVMFVAVMEKRNKLDNVNYIFLKAFIILIFVCLLEKPLTGTTMLFDNVLKRTTYLPSYLNHAYYDYFSVNPKMWFTYDVFQLEKIFRVFMPTNYYTGIVPIIAKNCFPGIPSPNTGLFAEAYAQAGFLGLITFPAIIAFFVSVMNHTAYWYGKSACMILLASFCISLTNVQILSSRVVVMVLVFQLITYVIRNVSWNYYDKS